MAQMENRHENRQILWAATFFLTTMMSSATRITPFTSRDLQSFQLDNVLGVKEDIKSATSCCVLCTFQDTCFAVLYHKATGSCTLGQGVRPGSTGSDSDLRLLSLNRSPDKCPLNRGYQLVQILGETFCVKFSTNTLNYDNATAECESNGGHLFHMDRSKFRVDALAVFVRDHGMYGEFYVGLDDRDQEGTFAWAYNGRQLSPAETDALNWRGNQPDNYLNNEDCITFLASDLTFNDAPCYNAYTFVCEVSL